MHHNEPSLLNINNDVRLEILDAIGENVTSNEPRKRTDLRSLKALSQANRHMRVLLTPYVFKSVRFGRYWDWERVLESLISVERCEGVKTITESFFRSGLSTPFLHVNRTD